MSESLKNINPSEEQDKRVFSSGAVRDSDSNKESYIESLSWLVLRRFAFYMKGNEVRYGRGNWKKGIPTEDYEESLLRHIQKYISNKYEGTNIEPEVDHLSAALFNLQGIIDNEERLKIDTINGEKSIG